MYGRFLLTKKKRPASAKNPHELAKVSTAIQNQIQRPIERLFTNNAAINLVDQRKQQQSAVGVGNERWVSYATKHVIDEYKKMDEDKAAEIWLANKAITDIKPIEKYSFDNNEKETPKKEYAKYFDMLKKGVPRRAVEQRMISEGIDIGVLDGKNIPLNNKNNPIPINKFSVQDLKNIKLKKTSQNKKIAKTKPRKGIQLGISLDSIQNALKSLKKTNIISSFSDL